MAGQFASSGANLSISSNASTLLQTSLIKVSLVFLLLPIPVMAVLGNLIIIIAVARIRSLQTLTNAFVVSLATADFLVAVLVMPFSLVRCVDSWRFGRVFCQVHVLLDVGLCTSSIYNLSCVALDRYMAVCDPLHYPTRMSTRRVGTMIVLLCWILPLVMSVFFVFLGIYNNKLQSVEAQICLAAFEVPFAIASFALSFFIPVALILFAYGKIFVAAQRQMRQICVNVSVQHQQIRTNSGRSPQLWKNQIKAAKSLGLIVGLFLVCWLPFFCVNVINPLRGYTLSPLILDSTMWLGYANSSLNPFLYAMFNKCYRRAFVSLFSCEALGRLFREVSQFNKKNGITIETVSG